MIAVDPAHTNNRDATLTFTDPHLKLQAVVSTPLTGSFTCFYGFDATHTRLQFDVFNRDNPNRPDTSVDDAQAKVTDASLGVQAGSDALCPSDAKVNGVATADGESSPGSGLFTQKLFITQ